MSVVIRAAFIIVCGYAGFVTGGMQLVSSPIPNPIDETFVGGGHVAIFNSAPVSASNYCCTPI